VPSSEYRRLKPPNSSISIFFILVSVLIRTHTYYTDSLSLNQSLSTARPFKNQSGAWRIGTSFGLKVLEAPILTV
jgi:hypothetical protein